MPFSIVRDEISQQRADVVIVPANPALRIDGGAGLAVGSVAGLQQLQAACDAMGGCAVGHAVATPAFGFPAKGIVHAVGPVWDGSGEARASLAGAYASALSLAAGLGARSIALPLISSGAQGCPANISLHLALAQVKKLLEAKPEIEVRIVVFGASATKAGRELFPDLAQFIDDSYAEEHENLYPGGTRMPSFPGTHARPGRDGEVPWRIGERTCGRGPERAAGPEPECAKGFALDAEEEDDEDGALPFCLSDAAVCAASSAPSIPRASRAPRAPRASEARETAETAHAAIFEPYPASAPTRSLEELLDELDASFSTTLLAIIDERGMNDADIYKRANLSRQHFSKIRSNPDYRPTKRTVLALAVALELDLDETEDLLRRAGLALSPASKADLIVGWFIGCGIYDIFAVNEALYAYDQPILG